MGVLGIGLVERPKPLDCTPFSPGADPNPGGSPGRPRPFEPVAARLWPGVLPRAELFVNEAALVRV